MREFLGAAFDTMASGGMNKGLASGVVRKSEGIYKYDDKILGASMEAVVIFLKDIRFKQLRNSIMAETYPEMATKNEQEAENTNFINTVASVTEEPNKKTTKK